MAAFPLEIQSAESGAVREDLGPATFALVSPVIPYSFSSLFLIRALRVRLHYCKRKVSMSSK
jgi:hypothetical protein